MTSFSNATQSTTELTYTWTIYEQGIASPVFVSNSQDIDFLFPSKSTYTVELVAYNGHYSTLTRVFNVDDKTKAAFEFYGCQLHFINLSTCATSCLWDFGDGKTSTENSPYHDYSSSGNYTAKLIVSNGSVKDSVSSTFNYYANKLTGKFTHRIKGDTVYFTVNDTLLLEEATDFYWSWGDATVTSLWGYPGQRVKHVYPRIVKDSTYTVFLLERTVCFDGFGQGSVFIRGSDPVLETTVFPNPIGSSGIFHIDKDNKQEICGLMISDLTGKLLKNFRVVEKQNGIDIDMSLMPDGVYCLQFYVNDDLITKKIIKN